MIFRSFAFAPVFIILSLSYEALFFAAFSTTLCLWIFVECRLANSRSSTKGRIEADHLRIALFFLTFLHVAFFGVGNVASISSVSSMTSSLLGLVADVLAVLP